MVAKRGPGVRAAAAGLAATGLRFRADGPRFEARPPHLTTANPRPRFAAPRLPVAVLAALVAVNVFAIVPLAGPVEITTRALADGQSNATASAPASPRDPAAGPRPALLRHPTVREGRYSLAGRVRPLLFWISRDNVGEARLTWMAGQNGELGYELLIGSDPDRAPRRINRWGYMIEVQEAAGVRVLGLMTESGEESYDQAKTSTGKLPDGVRVYKIIQATVGPRNATAAVQGVALSDQLTYRDLDAVLAKLPGPRASTGIVLPPGSEPGFLFAMSSLMRENVEAAGRRGAAAAGGRRTFVYGSKLYEVLTRSSRFLERTTIRGREYRAVIDSEFETRAKGARKGATYRVVYGTDGPLREIPIRIIYRPHWWFEAEMNLVEKDEGRASTSAPGQ